MRGKKFAVSHVVLFNEGIKEGDEKKEGMKRVKVGKDRREKEMGGIRYMV